MLLKTFFVAFITLFCVKHANCQAVVRLAKSDYISKRPGTFTVNVLKDGYSERDVDVIVQILEPSPSGRSVFVGSSQTAKFGAKNYTSEERSMVFTVFDDGSAEPDRVYSMALKISSGDAAISNPSVATLTVIGSNDPYGIFGFNSNGTKIFEYEKFINTNSLELTVVRNKGVYGSVAVSFQVLNCKPDNEFAINPKTGQVLFKDLETSKSAVFQLPNELPSPNVSCTIALKNVTTTNSSFDPTLNFPRLDGANSQVVVNIYPGDAYVRFSQSVYYVRVNSYTTSVQLTILRGVSSKNNSQIVGSLKYPATVRYYLLSKTAYYGINFQGSNSSLGFNPGISSVFLSVPILPSGGFTDAKSFFVVLAEPTGRIVLTEPLKAEIILNADIEINGVLSWQLPTDAVYNRTTIDFLTEFSSDESSYIVVWAIRNQGSLGYVSVQWELVINNSHDSSSSRKQDLIGVKPALGLLVFRDGEKKVPVNFTVEKDVQPRPLRVYRLAMMPETASGGVKINPNESVYYLVDRDVRVAYGSFDLSLNSSFEVDYHTRILNFTILRNFGLYDDVFLSYEVVHSSNGFVLKGDVLFHEGVNTREVEVVIEAHVLISSGSFFIVSISNARLKTALNFGPYESPRLGNATLLNATTSDEAANGRVGFNSTVQYVDINLNEYSKVIHVPVSRVGSFGNITMFWRVSSLESILTWNVTLDSSLNNFNGTLVMKSGHSDVSIPITITYNNITSFSERFYIDITDWEPKDIPVMNSEKLRCAVVLPEMGELAGTFGFCPWMFDSYVVEVEKDSIEICILRTGESLVNASVMVSVEPNSDEKFYGGQSVVYFSKVEKMKTFTIVAKDDDVPQLNITYTLRMISYGNRRVSIDVSRNISITVLPHSYPYGIIAFSERNLTKTTILRNNESNYRLEFEVKRFMGRFGSTSVQWMILRGFGDEIRFSDVRGTINFKEDQLVSVIDISFEANNMPRYNKTFPLLLINSSNEAILGADVQASINIISFDYAVYFNDSIVHLPTPGLYQVAILRSGPLDHNVTMKCRTFPSSATSGRDYVSIYNESVEFVVGERFNLLNISVLDDPVPRPDRMFYVSFYDIEGDIVPTNNLTVVVLAKHNSNGIFGFTPPYEKSGSKGSTVTYQLVRNKGSFDGASVSYEIRTSDCNSSLFNSSHFGDASGYVVFQDRQILADLTIKILPDDNPEFDTFYCIVLTSASGGPTYDRGIVDLKTSQVTLKIIKSNYPYGKLYFNDISKRVFISEDRFYDPSNLTSNLYMSRSIENLSDRYISQLTNSNGSSLSRIQLFQNNHSSPSNLASVSISANLIVVRSNGAPNYQRVSWETYSYQVASASTFPPAIDLLLLATNAQQAIGGLNSGIKSAPDHVRNGTGTNVLQFSGCDGCFVTVVPDRDVSEANSLIVSVWIKSFSVRDVLSGCIISRSSKENQLLDFAVCLKNTNSISTEIYILYPNDRQQTVQQSIALGKIISDYTWHYFVLEVLNNTFLFYLDGILLNQSQLQKLSFSTGTKQYHIGGLYMNQNNFFGFMQDLRIYGKNLNNLQIQELYLLPAYKDLEQISGYLKYNSRNSSQNILMKSIDNTIPETNKVFTVRLVYCRGLSEISTSEDIAILTILKSDNANGLFSLESSCIYSINNLATSSVFCPVRRDKGTFDSVVISWTLKDGEEFASLNFIKVNDSLVFGPGVLEKNITLELKNDGLPKNVQHFELLLIDAIPSDSVLGPTPTSGASISPQASSVLLEIPVRNYPSGFFQFSEISHVPSGNFSMIKADLETREIQVDENIGMLKVVVVRSQGSFGKASVEWKTIEGTARNKETSPDYDFEASAGRLYFDVGELYRQINITIVPPKNRKSDRQFNVVLLNSSPTNGSGVGPYLTVNIGASASAYGVFGFDQNSRVLSVSKNDVDVNKTAEVAFKVSRGNGWVGFINVTWEMFCSLNLSSTILSGNKGILLFQPNQTASFIIISVLNDGVPSLQTNCSLILSNPLKGILNNSTSSAVLIVLASNDPYGMFVVTSDDRFKQVDTSDRNITITIERRFGLFGKVKVFYSVLTPEESYSFLPPGVERATLDDFIPLSGEVLFDKNTKFGYFNVTIKRNSLPSLDSSVFARITGVYLVQPEQDTIAANSPRLGVAVECFARIEIKSHDFPHGVLEFSSSFVKIPQNFSSSLGNVLRSAGSVGQVSVGIEAVSGTAQAGVHYVLISNVVSFANGETRQSIPVSIVNRLVPQTELQFTIRLVNGSATGGAFIGDTKLMTVVIEKSLDINGVFGFDQTSSTLMETDLSKTLVLKVVIVRSRGTVGVVALQWTTNTTENARLSTPPSGQIFFLSSEIRENLTLEFRHRSVDDPVKTIVVKLLEASNGGLLDTSRQTHSARIIPTFNSYGVVQFASPSFILNRMDNYTEVVLDRINGTSGDLQVFYSFYGLNLEDVSVSQGQGIFSYFSGPFSGNLSSMRSAISVNISTQESSPSKTCTRMCLYNSSCFAFQFNSTSRECIFSLSLTSLFNATNATDYLIYVKKLNLVQDTLDVLAVENEDFKPERNLSFIFPNGEIRYYLPIKIYPTAIPKLERRLNGTLVKVELSSGDVGNPNFQPSLGSGRDADIRIQPSNDPHGVFTIYHMTGGLAEDSDQEGNVSTTTYVRYVVVQQRPDYAVLLGVERSGGLLGSVSVDWFIDTSRSTAVNGVQFSADGATLTFTPQVKLQVVSINILKYDTPSNDVTIIIGLKNPRGGARIQQDGDSMTIVIAAHDYVAGIIGFRNKSATTEEGSTMDIILTRTSPGLGLVQVWWNIVARFFNQTSVASRFSNPSGYLIFQSNELQKNIQLNVTIVQKPAINDEYIVQLVNVSTFGIRATGQAIIDVRRNNFVVTIEGGRNPHGVFLFNNNSRQISVKTSNFSVELIVERQFGSIGDVYISYSISSAQVPANDGSVIPAIANVSFVPIQNDTVVCIQGSTNTSIFVTLLDDGQSRPNEIILVSLLFVKLDQSFISSFQPQLATDGIKAQVKILEREGAYGVAIFRPQYALMTVSSLVRNVTVEVYRSKGLYRNVTVFCFAQPTSGSNGAVAGVDYAFEPQTLYFQYGVASRFVTVDVLTNSLPRPERKFQLILNNPTNGMILGFTFKATVTILANGQMAGTIAFQITTNVTMKPDSLPYLTTVNLPLYRGSGTTGLINVPYVIKLSGVVDSELLPVSRIQPPSGVVTFRDRQTLSLLELRIQPGVIYADEFYEVQLLPPDGGAVLSSPSKTFIQVYRKGFPFGLVQLYFADVSHAYLREATYESYEQTVELVVKRSVGFKSRVSVDIAIGISAKTLTQINDFVLTPFQVLMSGIPNKLYQFSAYGGSYVLSIAPRGISGCTLFHYRWQGCFTLIQTLELDLIISTNHENISGTTYVVLSTTGLSNDGLRVSKIKVFEVLITGMLNNIQDIAAVSASDAIIISSSSKFQPTPIFNLLILSYQDKTGRTSTISQIYTWDNDIRRFITLSQSIATKGALSVKTFKSRSVADRNASSYEDTYAVVANYFDSDYNSYDLEIIVYSVNGTGRLDVYQRIPLTAPVSLLTFDDSLYSSSSSSSSSIPTSSPQSNLFLAVVHDFNTVVSVFLWYPIDRQFRLFQKLVALGIIQVFLLGNPDSREKLLMLSFENRSSVYKLEKSNSQLTPTRFSPVWEVKNPDGLRFVPLTIMQSTGLLTFFSQSVNNRTSTPLSLASRSCSLLLFAPLNNRTSFYPNLITVTLEEGQSSQNSFVSIIGNRMSDVLINFNASLVNPQNGSEIGDDWTIQMSIKPNASFYGVFQFHIRSQFNVMTRSQSQPTSCTLYVQRDQGMKGAYSISWRIDGSNQIGSLFVADSGQVIFSENETESSFTVILSAGMEFTSDVNVSVVLYDLFPVQPVDDQGFSLPARIGSNKTAVVKIQAKEAVFGVFQWESSNYSVSEIMQNTITLAVVRLQGLSGRVRVYYMTTENNLISSSGFAVAWRDFIPVNSSLLFDNGVKRVLLNITILKNSEPEITELFYVRIYRLELLVDSTSGSPTPGGPVLNDENSLTQISIEEHGNPRGTVQFSIFRNEEGRIDVNEGEQLFLSLVRASPLIGQIEVEWIVNSVTSSSSSSLPNFLQPTSGTVKFIEGQTAAYIQLETLIIAGDYSFRYADVVLVKVNEGGGSLGSDVTARIGIRSMSPRNSFVSLDPTRVEIKSAQTTNDPIAVVSLNLLRTGISTIVDVQWRLDVSAFNLFSLPHSGQLSFNIGEAQKELKFQGLPGSETRGLQIANVTLVGVTDGSILNPAARVSTIIISPRDDVVGYAVVTPASKVIVVSRPRAISGDDGSSQVFLSRNFGFRGELKVAWKILPSDENVFLEVAGEIGIDDLQSSGSVKIIVLESSESNLQREFTFQITSLMTSRTDSCKIILLPCNYPYGFFTFDGPSTLFVDRKLQSSVKVNVTRKFGSYGSVRLSYGTVDLNATQLFRETSNWVEFLDGVKQKSIEIRLFNSTSPVGLGTFQINLTKVELLIARSDYDTTPLDNVVAIGRPSLLTVYIKPDPDAGGIIQFKINNILTYRDYGSVSLPVKRGPGTYGDVQVNFLVGGITAKVGDDYYPGEGWIVMSQGSSDSGINISLVNDGRIKPSMSFNVRIVSVSNLLSKLGSEVDCLVTIEKSGYPYGKFGFVGPDVIRKQNLDVLSSVTISIKRTVSTIGVQKVFWQVFESDVKVEVTSSSLEWGDGEGGSKSFNLVIKAHTTSWEMEEKFVVKIIKIESTNSSEAADIDPLNSDVTLVIAKYGYLNGLLRFESTLTRYYDEPAPDQKTTVSFKVIRSLGTNGDLKIYWKLSGTLGFESDFENISGSSLMNEGQSGSSIDVVILSDGRDEFDELFVLTLTQVVGGADLDGNYSSVSFVIRGHGFPCGLFFLSSSLQKFVVNSNTPSRKIIINVTRSGGLLGNVLVRLSLTYDQSENNFIYTSSNNLGFVIDDQMSSGVVETEVNVNVFLHYGSNFTSCLTSVSLLSANASIQPAIDNSNKCVKINVPDFAANSKIGFPSSASLVNSGSSKVAVKRLGSFGPVTIGWTSKKSGTQFFDPSFVLSDRVFPSSGSIQMPSGQSLSFIDVKLEANASRKEIFALSLLNFSSVFPVRFLPKENLTCFIQPDGIVAIKNQNLNMTFNLSSLDLYGSVGDSFQVSIDLERSYGSLSVIEVSYSAYSSHADDVNSYDYRDVRYGIVRFDKQQQVATLVINIDFYLVYRRQGIEYYFINLTQVKRADNTSNYEGSFPLLDSNRSYSRIVLTSRPLTYGIFSIKQIVGLSSSWPMSGSARITIARTDSFLDYATVNVRSVGGGEPWDATFGRWPVQNVDTIAAVLSQRDMDKRAYAGSEYQILNATVEFKEGEMEKYVNMSGFNFIDQLTADKEVYVYVRVLTLGTKVARPSLDGALMGYAVIPIKFDKRWKEIVGLVLENSTHLIGDEDSGNLNIVLTIDRINSTLYKERTVDWRSLPGTVSPDDVIVQQTGSFKCPAGQQVCFSQVFLRNDQVPRNATWLLIELFSSNPDDDLLFDTNRKICNLTLKESDFPNGKVEFSPDSRYVFVAQNQNEVQLSLERSGYLQKTLVISLFMSPSASVTTVAGVTVLPAVEGIHYSKLIDSVVFFDGISKQKLVISLLTSTVQSLKSPVQFLIKLTSSSSGGLLGSNTSYVTVTNAVDWPAWNIWYQINLATSNDSVLRCLVDANKLLTTSNSTSDAASVINSVLNYVSTSYNVPSFLPGIKSSMMDAFCSAIQPERVDSFKGFVMMTEAVNNFAKNLLPTGSNETGCSDWLKSSTISSCAFIGFEVKQKRVKEIGTYTYDDGAITLSVQANWNYVNAEQCIKLLMVVYKSSVWFQDVSNSKYLENKIINFGVFTSDGKNRVNVVKNIYYSLKTQDVPSQTSKCVFCEAQKSTCPVDLSSGACQVTSNLLLGISKQIDCSCSVEGGILAVTEETSGLLYPIWFHASCLIVVVSSAVSIFIHVFIHLGYNSIVKLTMQMMFAIFSFQLSYVLDVFLSPLDIFKSPSHVCIIVSLIVHYFLIAQFVWIVLQIYDAYEVLHLNDETTSEKFLRYFITGWGTPAVIVSVFYLITYLVYRYATQFQPDAIYGDVTEHRDVCFITNIYAALLGTLLIVIVCSVISLILTHRMSTSRNQWLDYDDIYKDSKNSTELILMIILWLLPHLFYLLWGLHLIFKQPWILAICVSINLFMGSYILFVYGIMRCFNYWRPKSKAKSAFVRIKNIKRKKSGDLKLVSKNNEISDVLQFEELENTRNEYLTDDVAFESNFDEESYPNTSPQSPTSFRALTSRSFPKLQLRRSDSEQSVKPGPYSSDSITNIISESSDLKKDDIYNKEGFDDLISVLDESLYSVEDIFSINSSSFEQRNETTDQISDIFV